MYSTVEGVGDELRTFPRPFSQHGTPYIGGGPQPIDTPVPQAPRGRAEHGRDGLGEHECWWRCPLPASLLAAGANGKMRGHPVNPPVVTWTELLPPPPSASELSHCAQEEEEEDEEEDAAGG